MSAATQQQSSVSRQLKLPWPTAELTQRQVPLAACGVYGKHVLQHSHSLLMTLHRANCRQLHFVALDDGLELKGLGDLAAVHSLRCL